MLLIFQMLLQKKKSVINRSILFNLGTRNFLLAFFYYLIYNIFFFFLANEIIEQSDLGLHNLEKAAAIYCVNPNSRSRIQGVALHFNVTGIASFRRFDSYRSELHHLETVNTVLHNTSPDKQTAKTTQIVRRYLTTTVSATSKTFDRNHEVGAGVKVTAGFDFIEKAEVEISGNYKYHNGSSEKTDTSITTTFEKTVTVPSQDIVIRPNSDLHVTTEFFSVREQVFYFVDLVISNATITTHDPAALAILGTYETTDLMPKLDELVDRPEFGEEDIQIGKNAIYSY